MDVYQDYCKCKELLGELQYLSSRKRQKERQLVSNYALDSGSKNELAKKINCIKQANVLDGYSDVMKREIAIMKTLTVNELAFVPWTPDKYFNAGVANGRKNLNSAIAIFGD